jgi:hypothetical protein
MKRIAALLENLVEQIPALEKVAAAAQGVTNADLRALLAGAHDQTFKARVAFVGTEADVEYVGLMLAHAVAELKRIADLTDDEATFESTAADEPAASSDELAPLTTEDPAAPATDNMDPAPAMDSLNAPSDVEGPAGDEKLAPTPEVTVDVQIDGEGVEVVHGEDSKLYVVLPDNAVLSLAEATSGEAKSILAKLNRL